MKRILITGASGFLGYNLLNSATESRSCNKLFGCYNLKKPAFPGIESIQCDLSRPKNLIALVDSVKPDTIIYCAAVASPETCEIHPHTSYLVNCAIPALTAEICSVKGVRMIYTSTDLVFNGLQAPYKENDPVSPINVYGEHKAEAEKLILSASSNALICRLPLMYGLCSAEITTFTTSIIHSLRDGKKVKLFCDEFRTVVNASSVGAFLLQNAESLEGIIHLGGRERISRYDFGVHLAKILKLDPTLIERTHQTDITTAAPRPPDVSLDSSKAFALGYCPGLIDDELEAIKPELLR